MSVMAELLCARCGHAADLHGVEGMKSGCMVRHPAECDCPAKWERIYDRAVRRMSAGLPVNTESDPDAESAERLSASATPDSAE